jgi:hypothetical protein
LPLKESYINDATLQINPIQKLKPDSKYRLEIDLSLLPDASGNITDTTIAFNFTTKSEFEFSGLSGKVVSDNDNLMIVLESELNSENKYSVKLDPKKTFEFERILPGRYKLWAFEDRNENGKYDYGLLSPFEFSERFYFYPEIIEIKPRWSISDLIFTIQ